ncbi:hypothetical protein GYMLUDRAFT_238937 [Collybiopsis luxurians FD-317 M1]|nr:hypothetical protein GYMLUDRAFT_238937 [Collybiopsis luxurians FD-317 M1]
MALLQGPLIAAIDNSNGNLDRLIESQHSLLFSDVKLMTALRGIYAAANTIGDALLVSVVTFIPESVHFIYKDTFVPESQAGLSDPKGPLRLLQDILRLPMIESYIETTSSTNPDHVDRGNPSLADLEEQPLPHLHPRPQDLETPQPFLLALRGRKDREYPNALLLNLLPQKYQTIHRPAAGPTAGANDQMPRKGASGPPEQTQTQMC